MNVLYFEILDTALYNRYDHDRGTVCAEVLEYVKIKVLRGAECVT